MHRRFNQPLAIEPLAILIVGDEPKPMIARSRTSHSVDQDADADGDHNERPNDHTQSAISPVFTSSRFPSNWIGL